VHRGLTTQQLPQRLLRVTTDTCGHIVRFQRESGVHNEHLSERVV
jgi:hypothetical protein